MREKKVTLKLTKDEATDLLVHLACRKDFISDQIAKASADNLDFWQKKDASCEALLVHVRNAL
jgi:hypothetical protein